MANSSKDALEMVAKHLDKTVPAMLLPYAAKILAHTLMLRSQAQYEQALHFLGGLLVNGSLRIDMLVNSHRMEILSELVISLADPRTSSLVSSYALLTRVSRLIVLFHCRPCQPFSGFRLSPAQIPPLRWESSYNPILSAFWLT